MLLHVLKSNGCVRECGFQELNNPSYNTDVIPSACSLYKNPKNTCADDVFRVTMNSKVLFQNGSRPDTNTSVFYVLSHCP